MSPRLSSHKLRMNILSGISLVRTGDVSKTGTLHPNAKPLILFQTTSSTPQQYTPAAHAFLIAGEGLAAPTSTGLSRYMLDTYSGGVIAPARPNAGPSDGDPTGVDPETPSSSSVLSDASSSPPGGEGDNQEERPPRYGAFVFGDRIPVNVTVDWDSLRERPEVLESALEVVGDEILPPGGGEFDLQVEVAFCDGGVGDRRGGVG